MGFHYKRPECLDRNPVWESVKGFLYFWEAVARMPHTAYWAWDNIFLFRIFWDLIMVFLYKRLCLNLGSSAISVFHTVSPSISGCRGAFFVETASEKSRCAQKGQFGVRCFEVGAGNLSIESFLGAFGAPCYDGENLCSYWVLILVTRT